jgi:hypothetical protein
VDSGNGSFQSLQHKAEQLAAEGEFLGGRLTDYERAGRLQLEVLIHEGMYPTSKVLDFGCGALRGSYWTMHFLEPGCFFGLDPHPERIELGLKEVVEPELRERLQPTFAYNEDFDISVFDVKFDFVIARSVWTHAAKHQIERMLDTFMVSSEPAGAMLVSYHPASKVPDAIRRPTLAFLDKAPKVKGAAHRMLGRVPRKEDYQGTEWLAANVSHSSEWISDQCKRRGLQVKELDYGIVNSQIWLRIERKA